MDIYLPTVFLLMDSIKKLYSTLFQHSFKRSVYVVAGLIVALSLPVTLLLAQQQQDLRQRAYSPNEGNTSYNSGSSCYSYNNRGTGCSCTSNSQCSSRNCSGYNNVQKTCKAGSPTATVTPTPTTSNPNPSSYPTSAFPTFGYGNCSASTGRGTYCGCTDSSQCSSSSCISYAGTGYRYCSPGGGTTSPTPTPNCGLNNRPSGCSCQLSTQCQQGLSCTSGKCSGGTTPTPSPTATSTPTAIPTPTPTPVDMCTATNNRPQACSCTASSQCRSGLCSNGTCSPQPTEAVAQGNTGLNFSVNLPGIAQKLSTNEDNSNPVNSSRIATIQIFDSSNTTALQGPGGIEKRSLVFNTANYKFEGAIDLGAAFTTGSYTLKLGLDNTLKKQIGGILTITQGSASNTATLTQLVPGDIDQNNSIDILDYNSFVACYKNLPICTADLSSLADLNDNGTIDILDLNILQRGFSVRNGD